MKNKNRKMIELIYSGKDGKYNIFSFKNKKGNIKYWINGIYTNMTIDVNKYYKNGMLIGWDSLDQAIRVAKKYFNEK